jgi:hypothetical protein
MTHEGVLWGGAVIGEVFDGTTHKRTQRKTRRMLRGAMVRVLFVRCVMLVGLGLVLSWESGCATGPCIAYFQELKRKCQINFGGGTSPEGSKLDEYMVQPFSACQIQICERASINDIDCSDPETHIPGGRDGRFETCQETLPN